MTGRKGREGKKLAREILEYLGVSLLLSAFIFCFLFFTSDSVAEIYLMNRGMVLTQVQAAVLTAWLRSICLAASAAIFVVLFLSLLSGRISYLIRITEAVRALDVGRWEPAWLGQELDRAEWERQAILDRALAAEAEGCLRLAQLLEEAAKTGENL